MKYSMMPVVSAWEIEKKIALQFDTIVKLERLFNEIMNYRMRGCYYARFLDFSQESIDFNEKYIENHADENCMKLRLVYTILQDEFKDTGIDQVLIYFD